jgi:Ca-activated chloride channel family protein
MTESTDGAFCLRAAAENGIAPVLKGVQAQARLDGLLFGLTLRQTYRNTSRRTLEVVYTFPLPASAVLLGFAAEFDSHRVECQVLPREQAEEVYEEALAEGDAPALLEAGPGGLHTANLGNLKPGEQVVLEIRFAQLVAFDQGRLRLAIPTTIAPRYGSPERSGLHAHQVPEAALDADYPLEFSVLVAGALAGAAVECPTHDVRASAEEDGLRVELAPGARLDRDVVLLVTSRAEEPIEPAGLLAWSQGVGVAAFGLPALEQREGSPLAVKLLVDCSGSMGGDSIASARRALQGVAASLRPTDEVSFTRFGSDVTPALAPARCTPATLRTLERAIAATDADLGGTEMEKALLATFALPSFLVEQDGKGSGRADVLLITDGEVWDTRRMIESARRSAHRVFAIGVGTSPAEAVLRHLAEATGGACEFATPGEQLEAAAARMLHRMRQHVWTGLRAQWEGCASPAWELPLPAGAFGGDTLLAIAGFEGQGKESGAVDLLGDPIAPARPARVRLLTRAADGTEHELVCVNAVNEVPGDDLPRIAAARRIAAWEAADELEAQQSRHADAQLASLFDPEDLAAGTDEKARDLAVQHRLVTRHTHAVLVHERAEADKPLDESLLHRVKSMLAAGWGAMGSVVASERSPAASVLRSSQPSSRRLGTNAPAASMSMTSHLAAPSLWRSARTRLDSPTAASGSLDDIEIPAFLRRQSPEDGATEPAAHSFGPANASLEDLVVAIAAHLEPGGQLHELPALVRSFRPDSATLQAIESASGVIGEEATCWMLLALWVVQRPAGAGLHDFEPVLAASVSRAAITPGDIGRVWTIFEHELGQAAASALAAPAFDSGTRAGSSADSSASALSRRQQRLSTALSDTGG